MYKLLFSKLFGLSQHKVPATGIGLFRLFFGLVTLQEVFFLIYFNHLIFDPIPYLDVEYPMIVFFLGLWGIIAVCVTLGYRSQQAVVSNYILWIIFVNFTPMQRDFDGGFDLFMIGANFFLMFMPHDRCFALDGLRRKLVTPFKHYSSYKKPPVSVLAYTLPVLICLGFLYFDSAVHKMFAEHWRNGLGVWLPASMPFYISALDMHWFLEQAWLQKMIGYTIIIFQFTFLFWYQNKYLRPVFFVVGVGLHLGITLVLNIYPFGMGMLIFYTLVAPVEWYQKIGAMLASKSPRLIVFFDEQCPLCNRTVLILNHFDVFKSVDFKGAQTYASKFSEIRNIDGDELMRDLYALDTHGKVYSGVDTYARILISMRYLLFLGYFLLLPGVNQLGKIVYRKIADSRRRVSCDEHCMPERSPVGGRSWYDSFFCKDDEQIIKPKLRKLSKFLILLGVLQINSTLHYGLLYRLDIDTKATVFGQALTGISNSITLFSHTFLGITPHALYLHDHFAGYNQLVAITYHDSSGKEKFLPFVNQQGRMLAPNWGRVHSMWANIAVTPKINEWRLKKAVMRITAYWGSELGLPLDNTVFNIKVKTIDMPFQWKPELRQKNLSGTWEQAGTVSWDGKQVKILFNKAIRLHD